MRIVGLLLVVGCWRSPAPPPAAVSPPAAPPLTQSPPTAPPAACEDTWLLLHMNHGCADMRSGVSGYRVLEVVDGAHRGRLVVAPYNEMCRASFMQWNLSRHVVFGAAAKVDNDCTGFAGPDCRAPISDALVQTWEARAIEAYVDEAAARAAREEHCQSQ